MPASTLPLPGIDAAERVLGLSLKEIARAVHANESTLHRWRAGSLPTPVFLARLETLDELARELNATFRTDEIARAWLHQTVPALRGARPIDLIRQGRAETVTGILLALNLGIST
jgi:uncharacterized protein (DUF2384 family)